MKAPSRAVLVAAAIFSAAIALAAGIVVWHDARLARSLAADELRELRAAHRTIERQYARETALRAEMIAGNQAVTGYIAQALDSVLPGTEPDYTSVGDLLEERRGQLGLALVAILGEDGRVLASTDRLTGPLSYAESPLFREVRDEKSARSGLLVEDQRLMEMQVLPLAEYGFSEIYLLVASPLDAGFAKSIVDVVGADTGVDTALLADVAGQRRIAATTLGDGAAADAIASAATGKTGDVGDLTIGGVRRAAVSVPLFGDARARVVLVASNRPGDAVRDAARLPLLAGAGIASIVLLAAMVWFRWRWWSPFEALLRVAIYAADSGDLHLRAPVVGSGPVARLTDAFNRLCARASAAIPKS
ncbi:MAG: hypothetical protein ACOY82_13715 [Pseudomonadota bacterium]